MSKGGTRPTLAERKHALIAQCSAQRTHIGREVEVMRAPSVLKGGGIGAMLTGGMRGPLAIAGLVLGVLASRSGKLAPMLATGMSLYKLAQSGLGLLRSRAG